MQVVFHEVIDIDNDDDCADLVVIDKKVDATRKGKAVIDVDDYCNGQVGVRDSDSCNLIPNFFL